VFNWNGTALQPIRNYTTAFTIVPRATIINNALYLAWFVLENIRNCHGKIYMVILPLPHPTNQTTNTTTTSSSTGSVTTPTTSSMTNNVKPSPSALPTWVAVAVAVIVVLVLVIASLMIKLRKP
jgi:hypothetical protein